VIVMALLILVLRATPFG
jgi:ribose transport system permease protein